MALFFFFYLACFLGLWKCAHKSVFNKIVKATAALDAVVRSTVGRDVRMHSVRGSAADGDGRLRSDGIMMFSH